MKYKTYFYKSGEANTLEEFGAVEEAEAAVQGYYRTDKAMGDFENMVYGIQDWPEGQKSWLDGLRSAREA
ncbi:MAG: hypothetical protein J6Y62_00140 [Clostridia bacterium]|nr:hypothetical protein [Clostridia bacterium]